MPFPFQPKHVVVTIAVGGDGDDPEEHDVKFVPVLLRYMYPLKALAKQIGEAIGEFGSAKRLAEGKRKDIAQYSEETKGLLMSEVSTEPVDSDRLVKGAALRKSAIEKIINLFLEEKSMTTLTDMICSSLRKNDDPWRLESKDLREEGDIELITQLTIGMVEAHQGVLDPLLRMRGLAATVSGNDSGLTLVNEENEMSDDPKTNPVKEEVEAQ